MRNALFLSVVGGLFAAANVAMGQTSYPKTNKPVPIEVKALTQGIQKELTRVGCYNGNISGNFNNGTREALKAYRTRVGLSTETIVISPEQLLDLRERAGLICRSDARLTKPSETMIVRRPQREDPVHRAQRYFPPVGPEPMAAGSPAFPSSGGIFDFRRPLGGGAAGLDRAHPELGRPFDRWPKLENFAGESDKIAKEALREEEARRLAESRSADDQRRGGEEKAAEEARKLAETKAAEEARRQAVARFEEEVRRTNVARGDARTDAGDAQLTERQRPVPDEARARSFAQEAETMRRAGMDAAAGGGPQAMPNDTLLASVQNARIAASVVQNDNSERITEFLFATNRDREGKEKTTQFNAERQDRLILGAAKVSVPKHHLAGKIELPHPGYTLFGVTILAENSDREKHFIIQSVLTLNRERWLELASEKSGGGNALVFVHGYNVKFQEAVLRTSQIMYDFQYNGLVVLFSWPSGGEVFDYQYDRESALFSRKHFIDLLRLLQNEAGITKIDVLAHSMGNLVVADSLASQAEKVFKPNVNELIMAAPDLDRDQLLQAAPGLASIAKGITLYASSADKAISASRMVARSPRAGDIFGGKPIIATGIQTIDASVLGAEILGLNHSTFAEKRPLMNDIRLLLTQNLRPPNLRMSEIRSMPEGGRAEYWRFTD